MEEVLAEVLAEVLVEVVAEVLAEALAPPLSAATCTFIPLILLTKQCLSLLRKSSNGTTAVG